MAALVLSILDKESSAISKSNAHLLQLKGLVPDIVVGTSLTILLLHGEIGGVAGCTSKANLADTKHEASREIK